MVGIVPPHGQLDRCAVALAADEDGHIDQRLLRTVEISDECFEAALVVKLLHPFVGMTAVGEQDSDAGIQKRELAQAMLQRVVVEFDLGEGLGRGQEGDLGAGLAAGIAGRPRAARRERHG